MPAWGLRVAAAVSTLLVFVGAVSYTAAHVKNGAAPLQPPVSAPAPAPTPTPRSPGAGSQPSTSPTPRLTLAPGVRGATLPPITFTHVS